MTSFPGSPNHLKGGIVVLNASTSSVIRVITLQYNPATLSRSLQVQGSGDGAALSEALRLVAPPVETYTLEAEIDATDQMETAGAADVVRKYGISPQLAALESLLYPDSGSYLANKQLAEQGKMEILPVEAPLTLFVWSSNRVLPFRLTEFSITEEAFDPNLNPIRAKVNLGLRILTVNDLGFDHKGGSLFLGYHQQLERLAGMSPAGALGDLGLTEVP